MFSTLEGCHKYIRGCSVDWRDFIIHMEKQLDKILSISIENSNVLNIPQCTDYPPMYLSYPPNVLMVSLQCTEHQPIYSWYPSDVLNTPQCTHAIPLMYSWYPPDVLMVTPDVLMVVPDILNTPNVLNIS